MTKANLEVKNVVKKLMGECPCGFSVITPHGQDDAVAVMQYHVQLVHKKEYPKGATKAEALKLIKEVK